MDSQCLVILALLMTRMLLVMPLNLITVLLALYSPALPSSVTVGERMTLPLPPTYGSQ